MQTVIRAAVLFAIILAAAVTVIGSTRAITSAMSSNPNGLGSHVSVLADGFTWG